MATLALKAKGRKRLRWDNDDLIDYWSKCVDFTLDVLDNYQNNPHGPSFPFQWFSLSLTLAPPIRKSSWGGGIITQI